MKLNETMMVAVDKILPSELNPRRHSALQLKAPALGELAASMRAQGQKEKVKLRRCPLDIGMFELIDGERRWRAAPLEGITELAAEIWEASDAEVRRFMFITGTQGEQLSPLAQAHGYAEIIAAEGVTQAALARELGVNVMVMYRRLELLELPDFIQEAVDVGTLPARVANVIAGVPGAAQRREFAELVMRPEMQVEPLSVRAAEELRRARFSVSLNGAPFKLDDGSLVPSAGACSGCAWRAGNNPEVYGVFPARSQLANTCMRVECFAEKKMAAQHRVAEEYRAKGMEPLGDEENALAFPAGGDGLSYKVDLVEWAKPVPVELLKKEVAAASEAVRWEDIMRGGETQVVRRVGFDQSGKAVVLVRVGEAVCAADKNEQAIFSDETRLRYGLEKAATVRVPKAARGAVTRDEGQVMSEETAEPESDAAEVAAGESAAGVVPVSENGYELKWTVDDSALELTIDLQDGDFLTLTRADALALHDALEAALPHMAVKLEKTSDDTSA